MRKHTTFAAVGIAVILVAGAFVSHSLSQTPQINFTTVTKADITQAVNEDGIVDAAQDLSLSFQSGGIVSQVNVKSGDTVKKGQILVKLDSAAASAALSQAQAALSVAQANYNKLINGATGAQLNVSQAALQTAQTALDNAKKTQTATIAQQNLIVSNAQITLFNSGLAATPSAGNVSSAGPTISGTYTGTAEGQYNIIISNSGSGENFSYSGLENGSAAVTTTAPSPLGTKGLYIQFPSSTLPSNDTWTVNIPNTKASTYLANLNSYNAALQTQNQAGVSAQAAIDNAQAALAQAQSALQLAQTPPRPEDIASAKAQVDSAAAQLQTAQNNYNNNVLTAPIDGIITSVDTKIGETVAGSTLVPGVDAVKMISGQNLEVVAYLSEADIGKIKVGDPATVTLSAYGSNTPFNASVIAIDPGATVTNGVSAYKTTLEFAQLDDRIKTGMNANVLITDETRANALVIPQSAVITKGDQSFVLTPDQNGKVQETQIQTGISSLDGRIEVLSGLSEGQKIATFGN
ncbi:MAG: efflux RND transporter periplasmic adaptor subunit [Candidatus Doudnabacteria bacterium]|nr:efflux RND transporter periplasmic adaptor subunit [Candidatus Doudnabacteria bacterium]